MRFQQHLHGDYELRASGIAQRLRQLHWPYATDRQQGAAAADATAVDDAALRPAGERHGLHHIVLVDDAQEYPGDSY